MSRAKNLEVRVEGMPAWAETLTFMPGVTHRDDDAYLYEGQCHHLDVTDNDSATKHRTETTVRLAQWVYRDEVDEVGVVEAGAGEDSKARRRRFSFSISGGSGGRFESQRARGIRLGLVHARGPTVGSPKLVFRPQTTLLLFN